MPDGRVPLRAYDREILVDPFNKDAECPMCESTEISTVFHETVPYRSQYECSVVLLLSTSKPPEHLCRTCTRCQYRWPEATLRLVYANEQTA